MHPPDVGAAAAPPKLWSRTDTRPARSRFPRHLIRVVRVAAAVTLGVCATRAYDVLLSANLATVVPGEVYRSGQLSATGLNDLIDRVGVRSVVNLRGDNPTPWHSAEIEACGAAHVRHYDLAMSARELPEPETVLELLSIFREAPRPLLVHCKSGADRAGLASALYLIEDEGLSVDAAQAAGLCLWRGHVPLGGTTELDRFLALYRRHGCGKSLERWAHDDYPRIFMHEWRRAHT